MGSRRLSFVVCCILSFVSVGKSQRPSLVCKSQQDSIPCLFPFTYQNKTFNACTSLDSEGTPMCITNKSKNGSQTLDESEEHVSPCSEECLENRDIENDVFGDHDMKFIGDEGMTCRECINWKECPWAANIVKFLKTSEDKKKKSYWINFMKSQRCGGNGRNICCKVGPKLNASSDDPSFGTWKPRSGKFECGTSFDSFFIHGGENSKIGEFPFLALLGYPYHSLKCLDTIYLCGGSLINKHYVLTAAHCLTVNERPLKEIVLGEHDISSDPDCPGPFCGPKVQKRKPIKIIIHEDWNPNLPTIGFDIGLVRLNTPAILASDDIKKSFLSPVCLPWSGNDPGHDISQVQEAIVSGWGKVTNDGDNAYENYCLLGAATSILQKLNTKLVPYEVCNDEFSSVNVSKEQHICSGGVIGEDSCSGDSGGPLVYKANGLSDTPMYQIGVVSFGTTSCGIGKPGIYTKVVHFLPWIEKSIEP